MKKAASASATQASSGRHRTAITEEARENEMICLAMDLVEQRLRDGTATSQETTHFLKLGSSKDKLEREILKKQKELLVAKTEAMQSAKRVEELYANALNAMRTYSGTKDNDETV